MSKYQKYVPNELKPFGGRPGAMDAFKLPSLFNGKRIERVAPKIMSATTKLRWVPMSVR